MSTGGTSIGRLFVELGLNDADFVGGLKKAEQAVLRLQTLGETFGNVLDTAVTGAFVGATAAAAGFAAATAVVGANFQQAITVVGAISGATNDEMQQLEAKARELGASTAYSATQAATAMQDFARSGFTVKEMLDAANPALLLAGSSGSEMSQATTIMSATLAQFGLDATEAARVSDVYSVALRKSLFDMSSLTEAMKYAGTAGAGFRYSLEETTAAVAMFRNLGLEGSLAGTAFKMMLAEAASVGDKGAATLAKYGLQVQDINPELHSFAEIMETVGRVSMSTTDALEVFGTRAGANVVQIARSFADGSTEFYGLRDAMVNSAGTTQGVYDTMMDTVLMQAEQVAGAIEELMLTVFDTYKGPLQELLTELADTIAYVATYFVEQSGEIAGSFQENIQIAIDYLRANRQEFATTFTALVQGVSDAIVVMQQLLPVLRAAGEAMVVLWVANKVRTFTIFVQGLIGTFGALNGSLRGVMATMTAMSGGMYALVAAVGTAVALIIAYASALDAAEEAAERLRSAEAKLDAERKARDDAERKRAETVHDGMAARIGDLTLALQAEGSLTDGMQQHLDTLQRLTAEQVKAGLASGELFLATINGKQVVLDAATALELQWEATSAADAATVSYTATLRENSAAQRKVKDAAQRLNDDLATYKKLVGDGYSETAAFKTQLAEYGDTVEDAEIKARGYAQQLADLQKQEKGLTAERELALQGLQRRETAAHKTGQAEKKAITTASEATKERERVERELERAIQARVKAVEGIADEAELVGADEAQKAAILFQRRLDDLRATFATELALRRKLNQDVTQLVQDQLDAERALRALYDAQRAEEERQRVLDAAKRVDAQVAAMRQQDAMELANGLQQIELERQQAIAEAEGATAEQVAAINAIYDARRLRARAALTQEVVALSSKESKEILRLTRERDAMLAQLDEDMVQEREAVLLHYGALIEEQRAKEAEDAEDAQTTAEKVAAALRKVGEVALSAAKAAAQGMRSLVGGLVDLFASITGFQFDLFDAVSSITDDMAAAQELADKLASGEVSQSEYDDAMADLPATATAGAEAFVQELLDGVLLMVQTFAEAAPVLVEQLAAAIPQVVQALVDALPGVVQALVDALPGLLDALADGLMQLVQMVADQLPVLLQGVLEVIPQVIQALTDAFPILLAAVADGIAMILDALPGIVTALLAQLPTILQAIFDALDTIIIALVDAIPAIILAIVEALPTIVQSLVEGILGLVGTIITEIVGELIPAIVRMIPTIITALLQAVVLIIEQLVAMLPTLIEALLVAVTEIIVAIVEMLPGLLASIIEMLPVLISAIIELIPAVIQGIVSALPQIITALMDMLPTLIVSLITELIPALVQSIPALLEALLIQLPWAIGEAVVLLVVALGEAIWQALQWLVQFFKDVITEITSLGSKETETFGDTPGAVHAGPDGLNASFAPGDFVVAAQSPMELLRQAMEAAQLDLGAAVAPAGLTAPRVSVPGLDALSVAVLQAAEAVGRAGGSGGGAAGGQLRVTLQADGQVLDDVLFSAARRGQAPKLERGLRRVGAAAGVQPGFDRGKFVK